MPQRTKTFQAILAEVARGGDRSSLFWFLVEHHDEIVQQAGGKRLRWAALCERFAAHGLTDARGETATPDTARQTWLRARRVVVEATTRKQAADTARRSGNVYPSRISPDWRPTVVPPPPVVPAQQPAAAGSLVPAQPKWRADPNLSPQARAVLEAAYAQFEEVENRRLKLSS